MRLRLRGWSFDATLILSPHPARYWVHSLPESAQAALDGLVMFAGRLQRATGYLLNAILTRLPEAVKIKSTGAVCDKEDGSRQPDISP